MSDTTTDEKPNTKKPAAPRTKKAPEPTLADALAVLEKTQADPDSPEATQVAEFLAGLAPAIAEPDESPLPPERQPRNVVEAIVAVMRDVKAVGKDGRNQKQNYDFRGIDGTVNALGPAMRRYGLIVTPHLRTFHYGEVEVGRDRTKQAHARVEVTYTFRYSNANGELSDLSVEVPGESMDSGDKGTAKAMSVAFRICLLQTFTIPTDSRDPDEDSFERSTAPEPIPADALANAIARAAEQDNLTDSFDRVRAFYGARLPATTINIDGETLTGDVIVERAQDTAVAARLRAQQDADAQQDEARARASVDAHPEVERRETDNERQNTQRRVGASLEQERQERVAAQEAARREQEARAASAPRESGQQRAARQIVDEARFQAEVLNLNFADHVAPILRDPADLSSVKVGSATKNHICGFRPETIAKLREFGDATAAEAYERKGDGFPLVLTDVTNPDDSKSSREPAPAQ